MPPPRPPMIISVRTPNPPPPPFNESSPAIRQEITSPSQSSRPELVQEKIEVQEPGVAVARKGVLYTSAEDDEEAKEFEAKLLAMEQEMKAEKTKPVKPAKSARFSRNDAHLGISMFLYSFSGNEMNVSASHSQQPGTSSSSVKVPEIDIDAFGS